MNKPRTFVRSLTAEGRKALEKGRKSADPFTVRRAQVLLASADGHRAGGRAYRPGGPEHPAGV